MQLRSMLRHTHQSLYELQLRNLEESKALLCLDFVIIFFKTVKTNVVNVDYLSMIVHHLKHHVLS